MKQKPLIFSGVVVEQYAAEGKSLAKVNGKIIFIENTVPGDVVDVQIFKNKKDWAEGFPTRFIEYAAERVAPFCKHFGTCGGCQWQHLPYHKQIAYKQQQVEAQLWHIAKLKSPVVLPIAAAAQTTHYRNKLEYTFATHAFVPKETYKKQETFFETGGVAGFHAKGVFYKVVDVETCYLQPEPSNQVRLAIKKFALENHFPFYNILQHTGWLRNVQVRMSTTGEWMLNIVLGYDDEEKRNSLLSFIQQQFPSLTSLYYTINPKKNDSLNDLQPVLCAGKKYIEEKIENFRFKISPQSFFQTNTQQAERLYQIIRSFSCLSGKEIVYDLYCGTGSIGIFLSKQAKKIIGVDVVTAAINDAKENASLNNIETAEFFCGDVIDICSEDFFNLHGKPDVVIVDPPRNGLHKLFINTLLNIQAPAIVYVSCNPATQARDTALLASKYEIKRMQAVDMFPHTHHIENVMRLELKQ